MLASAFKPRCALWTALAVCLHLGLPGITAAPPAEPDEIARIIGAPVKVSVEPKTVTLAGPRSMHQLLVTGEYADGSLRDLTALCDYRIDNDALIAVQPHGFVVPRQDGKGTLSVRAGGQSADVPIAVSDFTKPTTVSFRREVVAALGVSGCNGGSCHGIPSGRNGFRLSLWGHDPAADFVQLTRDMFGRRTDPHDPDASLILAKALGRVPHEGGQRFGAQSLSARILRGWIAHGLADDPASLARVQSITVTPGQRSVRNPGRCQQLAVGARYADGSSADVTRLTVFTSSDKSVADVTATGLVEFQRRGEVAVLCRYLDQVRVARLVFQDPPDGFRWPDPANNNYVDEHVFAKLKAISVAPSELAGDREFLRRAYLDVCGILPTADEARAFLADQQPNKRATLIDALLERPEYADFWTMKWGDVLKVDRETLQLEGAKHYHQWLREQVAKNVPLDQLVRTLLTSTGHSHKDAPANYFAVVAGDKNLAEELTETTAQLFLGVRIRCAKCHNHPYERWTQDDYFGLAAFYAQVKQTRPGKGPEPNSGKPDPRPVIVELDPKAKEVMHPRTNQPALPRFVGGAVPTAPAGADRRTVLADWLVAADNPFFAKAAVNRTWYHLMGQGIVDPVDDFRDSNPSANDELLDALAKDFVVHKFDVKHIARVILNSRTYQLSSRPNPWNKDDNKYFARAVSKLLPAEVLLDAISAVTEVSESYEGFPAGTRAIQLPDNRLVATGHKDYPNSRERHPFMKAFGQPARESSCECEREGEPSLAQALELIGGPTVAAKLREPNNRLGKLLAKGAPETEILNELYMAALCRPPSEQTAAALLRHVARAEDKRKAWEDVLWTILRSQEFIFRH